MRKIINLAASIALIGCVLMIASFPAISHATASASTSTITTTSYYTSTVTNVGVNVPDVAHINDGFLPLLIPLIFASLFGGICIMLKRKGDFFVTLFLLGLMIGSAFGALVAAGDSNGTVPFAMLVVTGTAFILWLWQGGVGDTQ